MDRRSFLSALGLAAAEVVCYKVWASESVSPTSARVPQTPTAIRFKKLDNHYSFDLLRQPKFQAFFETQFPGVTAPFDRNVALYETVKSWMTAGKVSVSHNRFLAVSGFNRGSATYRGMMWIDATKPKSDELPLVVLSFLTSDPKGRKQSKILWVVPNQPISSLTAYQVPHNFQLTMSRWLRSRRPMKQDGGLVRQVVFYEPSAVSVVPDNQIFGIKSYRTTSDVLSQTLAWGRRAELVGL